MPRGTFLGRETLGPEDVSPEIPDDSPRRTENRNGHPERAADDLMRRMHPGKSGETHTLWECPERVDPANGLVVPAKVYRLANNVCMERKGWRRIGPCPGSRNDLTPEQLANYREHLNAQAYEPKPAPYYTGRRFLIDGEVVHDRQDDREMGQRVTKRGEPLDWTAGKRKP